MSIDRGREREGGREGRREGRRKTYLLCDEVMPQIALRIF